MNVVRIAIACVMLATVAGAQVRDKPTAPRAGTASVGGVVLDDQQRPVRRALVRLDVGNTLRTVVTETDGRFAFAELPAGQFSLTASKPSYVTAQYGAKRPGRPGTSLVVAAGARVGSVVLTLARGAVITGTLLNAQSEPAPGTMVRLFRSRIGPNGPSFVGTDMATTDDRGVYRFYGLLPGEYLVGAVPPRLDGATVGLVTQADVDRARRDLQTASSGRGGAASTSTSVPPSQTTLVSYASVWFPGATDMDGASRITLAIGEERSGVDFKIDLVPTVRVEGMVVRSDGQPPAGARVALLTMGVILSASGLSTTTAGSDGRFAFTGIVPGEYVATAVVGSPATPSLQALVNVTVGPGGVSGLILTMGPGPSVRGRVRFLGEIAKPPDPTRLNVALVPRQVVGQVSRSAAATPDAAGAFTLANIVPGRYLWNVTGPASSEWMLSSVVINGAEVIDSGSDLTGAAPTNDVLVTLTNQRATLSGVFQDASGQPAADYTIILYPTDRSAWGWQSRRIKAIRPVSDGRFTFSDLLPGEYLLTAVTDVEPDEWFDPKLLEQLIPASIRIAFGEGEKKTQDIRIR